MKRLLVLSMLFLSIFSFSQNVKVKKGEIQVDDKPVAKMEKKDKVYVISSLSGTPLFTAVITDITPLKNVASKRWLQLTGNNGNVREVAIEKSGGFTFSNERFLCETLIRNAGFLFPNTVNEVAVNEFFQTEDRSISKAEDIILEAYKKNVHREDSLAKANNLVLDDSGNISANGKKIGYLVRKTSNGSAPGITNYTYIIMDINKTSIAQLDFPVAVNAQNNIMGKLLLKTYDNQETVIRENYILEKIKYDNVAIRAIRWLYTNGYTLGDMSGLVK